MGSEARKRARARIREEREKEKRAAQRKKTLLVVGSAAAAVLLIVVVGYAIMTADRSTGYEGELAQETLQADGSVVMARPDAEAPVVEVYADYQCPACRQFENTNGDLLKEMAAESEAIVHQRPVSIFAIQPAPTSSNSLRAGAAARAAADHDVFVEYNDLLFAHQPNSAQEGYTTDELKEWFRETDASEEQASEFDESVDAEVGVVTEFTEEFLPALNQDALDEIGEENLGTMALPDLLVWGEQNGHDSSFLDGTYTGEIINATETAYTRYSGENMFRGTPAVYINGTQIDNDSAMSPRDLRDAIESAGAGEVESEPMEEGDANKDP